MEIRNFSVICNKVPVVETLEEFNQKIKETIYEHGEDNVFVDIDDGHEILFIANGDIYPETNIGVAALSLDNDYLDEDNTFIPESAISEKQKKVLMESYYDLFIQTQTKEYFYILAYSNNNIDHVPMFKFKM